MLSYNVLQEAYTTNRYANLHDYDDEDDDDNDDEDDNDDGEWN